MRSRSYEDATTDFNRAQVYGAGLLSEIDAILNRYDPLLDDESDKCYRHEINEILSLMTDSPLDKEAIHKGLNSSHKECQQEALSTLSNRAGDIWGILAEDFDTPYW